MDFKNDIENGAVVWGVDPGVTSIFRAIHAFFNKEAKRVSKTITKGYYCSCGFKRQAQKLKWYNLKHVDDSHLISTLAILRISNIELFKKANKMRLQNYHRLWSYSK